MACGDSCVRGVGKPAVGLVAGGIALVALAPGWRCGRGVLARTN